MQKTFVADVGLVPRCEQIQSGLGSVVVQAGAVEVDRRDTVTLEQCEVPKGRRSQSLVHPDHGGRPLEVDIPPPRAKRDSSHTRWDYGGQHFALIARGAGIGQEYIGRFGRGVAGYFLAGHFLIECGHGCLFCAHFRRKRIHGIENKFDIVISARPGRGGRPVVRIRRRQADKQGQQTATQTRQYVGLLRR